tara:strand:- start:15669 stop:16730 length:1062 start_codon:yes stop_codon:yes gene_type:complete
MVYLIRALYIFTAVTILNGCNSYQLTSYYDQNNDGIYQIRSNSSKYKEIFDNIAYSVSQEDNESFDDQLPWGDNPDSREIVYNFFPSYGGFYPYNYQYGRFGFSPYNPYYYYDGFYGYGSYYSPYSFYLNPYFNYEYPYLYRARFGLSRYYPYNYYNGYDKNYYYKNNSGAAIAKINTRRGEKRSNTSKIDRSNLASNSSFYNRGSASTRVSNNFETNENDRVIRNQKGDRVNTIESEKIYSRYSNTSRESLRNINYVPNLNAIKREKIKNTYQEARSLRGRINNSPGYNSYRSNNYRNSSSPRTNSGSFNTSPRSFTRSNSNGSFSRSSSGGASRSSGSSRGSSSRGSGNKN